MKEGLIYYLGWPFVKKILKKLLEKGHMDLSDNSYKDIYIREDIESMLIKRSSVSFIFIQYIY